MYIVVYSHFMKLWNVCTWYDTGVYSQVGDLNTSSPHIELLMVWSKMAVQKQLWRCVVLHKKRICCVVQICEESSEGAGGYTWKGKYKRCYVCLVVAFRFCCRKENPMGFLCSLITAVFQPIGEDSAAYRPLLYNNITAGCIIPYRKHGPTAISQACP